MPLWQAFAWGEARAAERNRAVSSTKLVGWVRAHQCCSKNSRAPLGWGTEGGCRVPATQPGAAVHQGWEITASCSSGVVTLARAALPSWALLAPRLRPREGASPAVLKYSFFPPLPLSCQQAGKQKRWHFLSQRREIVVLIYSRMLYLHLIFVWRGEILVHLYFYSSWNSYSLLMGSCILNGALRGFYLFLRKKSSLSINCGSEEERGSV